MPDIAIVWNPDTAGGDWALPSQESEPYADLTAAVLVSLFTDRRVPDDVTPLDGTNDRRGWWADANRDEPIGSRLWLLDRARRTDSVRLAARDYCVEALGWMLRDNVARAVDVVTFWAGRTALGIAITIALPAGPDVVISVSLPWSPA